MPVHYSNIRIYTYPLPPPLIARPINMSDMLVDDTPFQRSELLGQYSEWNANWRIKTPGKAIIYFYAQASNDIYIGLSSICGSQNPMYEIVLGGWSNTQSVIRRSAQSENVVVVKGSACSYRGQSYWIMLNAENNTLSIGSGGEAGNNIIMEYWDRQFIPAEFISFSCYNGKITYHHLVITPVDWTPADYTYSFMIERPIPTTIVRRKVYYRENCDFRLRRLFSKYTIYQKSCRILSPGKAVIFFRAAAMNDIHIALSPKCKTMDPMYEIVLGGWGNSQSVIRRKSQGSPLATVTGAVCNSRGENYWIKIDGDNSILSVGFGNIVDENEIIRASDRQFIPVEYIAFSCFDNPIRYRGLIIASLGNNPEEDDRSLIYHQNAQISTAQSGVFSCFICA
jgi:hypothetical protein